MEEEKKLHCNYERKVKKKKNRCKTEVGTQKKEKHIKIEEEHKYRVSEESRFCLHERQQGETMMIMQKQRQDKIRTGKGREKKHEGEIV